jgi:AraC family transcriptional regulator
MSTAQPLHAQALAAGGYVAKRTAWFGTIREEVHQHRSARLVVLLSGTFEERVGASERMYAPGVAIVRAPDEPHRGTYPRRGGLYVSVELPGTDAFARSVGERGYAVRGAELRSLGARLAGEIVRADPWSSLTAEGIVLELLAAVQRTADPGGRGAPRWVAQVCDALREDPRTTWSLRELAALVGVEPAYLGRAFRRATGHGVGDELRAARVDRARTLIEHTQRPLADIAVDTGFCDQSHLTRAFRRVLGTTPAEHRPRARTGRPMRSTTADPS